MKHIGSIMPLVQQAIAIRKAIADVIIGLPDNDKINRISDSPSTFTMSSNNLFKGITSPAFYDFKHQYRMLSEVILELPIEDTVNWLNKTLDKGSFICKGVKIQLHPEVIEHIKGVIDGS